MKFKKIYIEITNICNLNCSFCSKGVRKKKEMSLLEFEHILKKIDPYTEYVYLHVKGEPFVHSNFEKILELCKKYQKQVNLTTNGMLLYNNIPALLKTNIVRQINISLHSQEDVDQTYLDNILKATKILLDKTDIQIVYRYWTLSNKKFLKEQKQIIQDILSFWNLGTSINRDIEKKDNIRLLEHLYLNKDEPFQWPNLEHPIINKSTTCYGLRKHLAILADGTVVPCCLDCDGIIALGNIYEQTLTEILNKERTTRIINDFQNRKVREELCQKCSYRLKFER